MLSVMGKGDSVIRNHAHSKASSFQRAIFCVVVTGFMAGVSATTPAHAQDLDDSRISVPFRLCLEQEKFLKGLTIHKAQTGEEAAAVVKNCHALLDAADSSGGAITKERLVRFYFLTAFAEFKVANLAAAEALYLRALDVAERNRIPAGQTWEILKDLGDVYRVQGDYAKAEALLQRALAIREASADKNNANVAKIFNSQAEMYRAQGQYAKAEALYLKAIAIVEQSVGTSDPFLGLPLLNLAELYRNQGSYAKAEEFYLRVLALWVPSLGPHPYVATLFNNRAVLFRTQGQYRMAEQLYQRSLSIYEQTLGPEHPMVAKTLNNLADIGVSQGQYGKAEDLYQRSLAISEKVFGPEHQDVATVLSNLGLFYIAQGQYAKAEPLFQRSLAIREKALGPEHPDVAVSLMNLALAYSQQGNDETAESLNKRGLAILESSLGTNHPEFATALNNLAEAYAAQGTRGKIVDAGQLHWRALSIREKTLGPEHQAVAESYGNLAALYELAVLYKLERDYTKAEQFYQRSLAVWEKSAVPNHLNVSKTLASYAGMKVTAGDTVGALALYRKANAGFRAKVVAGDSVGITPEIMASARDDYDSYISLLAKVGSDTAPAESFDLAQLRGSSTTGQAVGQMAARFATGSNAMAKSVRQRQDLALQLKALDDTLIKELGKATGERNGMLIDNLRAQSAAIKQELTGLDTDIAKRFPEYVELTRPEPLTIGETQKLLKDDEALLVYLLADEQSWVWVVRKNAATWRTLDTNKAEIDKLVASVRGRMNDSCGDLPCPAELGALQTLYTKLVAPISSELKDVRHLLLVPDGGLQGLPFSMLVVSPAQHATDPLKTDYTKVDWLAQHHSVTVLPAVQSLRALRIFARSEVGQEPFIGFGDPTLEGSDSQATARGKRIERKVALRGGLADTAEIRQLEPLPATATELKAIARTLKASPDTLWLRERATEDNVKTLDLSRYRTVAFATHGQLAGSVKGSYEPGLIFTPPAKSSEQNDGYLTASEAAQLKLRAEWVLLSACNTAAPDGTPGAEGLSGLAKAFFYAGGKTLLVSHWPVDSDATVKLTTTMMRLHQDEPKMTKAEAHRQSMLTLMTDRQNPEYAHPFYWAPFAIVGDGGR
jgi:CHAT domain-containing protein/Tfp pilus assembly protein PilF